MTDEPDSIVLTRSDDKPDRGVVRPEPAVLPAPGAKQEKKPAERWQKFGNLAQWIAPLVTGLAAGAAGWYVSDQIAANRQSAARQMFRSHLELELKYPGFTNRQSIEKEKGKPEYDSFVVHLLFTCEELMIAMGDKGWKTACESRMAVHSEYLCSEMSEADLDTYDQRIQTMVKSIGHDANGRTDNCKWATK